MRRLITALLLLVSVAALAQNKEVGIAGEPSKMKSNIQYSFNIPGRVIVAGYDRWAEFTEGGTVRVKIWIGRDGRLLRHEILSASNPAIKSIAEEKVKRLLFNYARDAAAEQSGTLTLKFIAGNNMPHLSKQYGVKDNGAPIEAKLVKELQVTKQFCDAKECEYYIEILFAKKCIKRYTGYYVVFDQHRHEIYRSEKWVSKSKKKAKEFIVDKVMEDLEIVENRIIKKDR